MATPSTVEQGPEGATAVAQAAAKARRTTAESIPDNSFTTVTFQSAEFDNDSMFSLGAPGILTIRTSGRFIVGAEVPFAANSIGRREIRMVENLSGTILSYDAREPVGVNAPGALRVETEVNFNVLDAIRIDVFQNSGGALAVDPSLGPVAMFAQRQP